MRLPEWVDVERLNREVRFDPQGRWLNTRLSELKSVSNQVAPDHVTVKDDTLRSGANTPGVYATTEMRLRIARKLAEAGVVEVEGGYPGIDEHVEFMRQLKREGLGLRVGAHAQLAAVSTEEYRWHVDRTLEAEAEIINWVARGSYLMTRAAASRLEGERELELIHEAITHAKSQGLSVAIGAAGSGDFETFRSWVTVARDAGADRLYIYDARGWYTPDIVRFLVRFVKDVVGDRCQVALHCHDDYGLATNNTIEGVRAGADIVDITVNRTGHRCGNASFEQVVVALEALHGIKTGIDLSQILSLSKLVSEVYGVPVPPNAPIVGDNMFSYGGLHLAAMMQGDWFLWENLQAETVGAQRKLVWGPTSVRSNLVSLKVAQLGLEASQAEISLIMKRLQEKVVEMREIEDTEMDALVREVLAG